MTLATEVLRKNACLELRALLQEGLQDIENGKVYPVTQVMNELKQYLSTNSLFINKFPGDHR